MAAGTSISGLSGNYAVESHSDAQVMKDYVDKVGKMDTKELVGELGKNLQPWQRDAVETALVKKGKENEESKGSEGTQGAGGGGGGEGGEDEIKKLLKKLMEGTISNEELQKLASLTGAKEEDLKAIEGKGGDKGPGDNEDFKGG